jgi:hypothetical protein
MTLTVTFPCSTFGNCSDALKFIYKFINFKMGSFSCHVNKYHSSSFHFEEAVTLLNEDEGKHFTMSDGDVVLADSKRLIIFRKDRVNQVGIFQCNVQSRDDIRIDELFDASFDLGFSTGILFDYKKAFWQSIELLNTYERLNRSHTGLKKIINPAYPAFMAEQVDIFVNPGHQKLTYGMILMAAPEMWFGPESLKYFDEKRLVSFPAAKKVVKCPNGLVHINLFDIEEESYETEFILDLQKRLRSWVDMDNIELELNKKSASMRS